MESESNEAQELGCADYRHEGKRRRRRQGSREMCRTVLLRLEVSGFKFQVSRWREYRTDGSLIEGQGVPADIGVNPTVNESTILRAASIER